MNTSAKKQTFLFILSIFFCMNAMAQFAGGTGTKKNPFEIETAQHLNNVRFYMGEQYYFVLQNNINLETYLAKGGDGWDLWGAEGWLPIGDDTTPFEGKFYGNGNKISGLYVNRPDSNYVGLFGAIGTPGEINSLHIKMGLTSEIAGNNYVGGICGRLRGTISNCSLNGSLSGEFGVGGIAGLVNNMGNIENSFTSGEIFCNNYGGGFVGYTSSNATILNCYSHTNVNKTGGSECFGGFVGRHTQSSIVNCYSTGWVKEGSTVQTNRGFAGRIDTGEGYEMTGCFWDTETSGASSSAGEATGKTTAEMTTGALTYPNFYILEGWDFKGACNEDVWNIGNGRNGGYPYFNRQYPDDPPFALFAGGDGSESDPFQITCAQHLDNVRNYLGSSHSDKHFILMNDINLSDYLEEGGDGYAKWSDDRWLPIGGSGSENIFYGKFNGNGHVLSELSIIRPTTEFVGLFGNVGLNGEIKNLGISSAWIYGEDYVGVITGSCGYGGCSEPGGTIENCFVTDGWVYGYGVVNGSGGLTGQLRGGQINNCFAMANVTDENYSGNSCGGFVGKILFDGVINNCYSTGWIKQQETIKTNKGFCGSTLGEYEITGCFWDTETSGASSSAGEATGKTTAEMTTYSTFFNAGWDFLDESTNGSNDYWGINSEDNGGYPFLAWQGYENDLNTIPGNLQLLGQNLTDGDTECYNAHNSIRVGGTPAVNLQSGSSATFIAGYSIRFLPDFHAHSGSYMDAHITTIGSFCDDLPESTVVKYTEPVAHKSKSIEKEESIQGSIMAEPSVKVYPNPNNGEFTVELQHFDGETRVMLFNSTGQLIHNGLTTDREMQLIIPHAKSGMYFIKTVNKDNQFMQKIVVR
ncbi:MAG: T9SS type A sorting domain-containing protein [Prolixibacteraceae bacterium]|nr:T9SS type A sorting domain-containing protein [Prolixibacteraceae bacterium]